jgi:hypothetical protein
VHFTADWNLPISPLPVNFDYSSILIKVLWILNYPMNMDKTGMSKSGEGNLRVRQTWVWIWANAGVPIPSPTTGLSMRQRGRVESVQEQSWCPIAWLNG